MMVIFFFYRYNYIYAEQQHWLKKNDCLLWNQEEEEEEEEEEELEEDAVERMRNDLNEVYDDDINRLEAVQVSYIVFFIPDNWNIFHIGSVKMGA